MTAGAAGDPLPGPRLPQPTVRGTAHVDWGANREQVKITVWIPKEHGCAIDSDDEVEMRTLSRVMRYDWERPAPPEG